MSDTGLLSIADGSFETGVAAWTAVGGAVTQSSAQAFAGTYSALLTVSGSPVQSYIRAYDPSAIPCTPGYRYRITARVRSAVTLTVNLAIDWFDAGGNYLTTTASAQSLAAGAWEARELTGTAPAGAASFAYGPSITGSPANGSLLYIDDLNAWRPITVIDQDVYPPRAQITVQGLEPGDQLQVYREVESVRTLVRGGTVDDVDSFAYVLTDAELPFGVPVRWVAVVNDDAGTPTAPFTYTLPGGKVVISDAIRGLAAEVIVASWPEWSYSADATLFSVQDSDDDRARPRVRNVVVTSGLSTQHTATIELFVDTDTAARQVRAVVQGATQGIVQIRQPGGYADTDAYLSVLGVRMRRYSGDGSDPRRLFVLEVAQVDAWASAFTATGWTLQDLADVYDGLTLADVAADHETLLDLAQADLSS